MSAFEYEDRDYLLEELTARHRSNLLRYVPLGGQPISSTEVLFWRDTIARFLRGEWADAVTAIERRFEPMGGGAAANDNAYVFDTRGAS